MDYNREMEKIIESLDHTPSLLLHSCCAPCSSAVLERLMDHFDITILYYNPNIEPYEEYLKRKDEEKEFISKLKSHNKLEMIDADYDNEVFKTLARGHEDDPERGPRCYLCYKERLSYTFKKAERNNFEFFGTTLSVSPYKSSRWLNEIGLELETEKTKFLPADFKKKNGYKRSIELSKEYELYRQDYCGCIYSRRKSKVE